MTRGTSRLIRTAVLVAFAAAALWLGRSALRPAAPGLSKEIEVTAEPSKEDRTPEVRVLASGGGLRPNVVYSLAGHPLRIVVRAPAGGGGPDRLEVPDLGIAAELAPDGETVVAVPIARRGAFRITDRAGRSIGALRFQ